MNNFQLIRHTPFSFLSTIAKKPTNSCGLAWLDNSFHLSGDNYYIYSCHTCQTKQIKKGQKPPAVLNWGGSSW